MKLYQVYLILFCMSTFSKPNSMTKVLFLQSPRVTESWRTTLSINAFLDVLEISGEKNELFIRQ